MAEKQSQTQQKKKTVKKRTSPTTQTIVINMNQGQAQTQTQQQQQTQAKNDQEPKDWTTALLLCIFLGVLGAHRFYVGKAGTGILWLFSYGAFGIGWIVDLIMIATGAFTDGAGNKLVKK